VDDDLGGSIMEALRRAREPVFEPVLYERVRGLPEHDVTPERFLAVLERLLMLGRIRLSLERETPQRAPAPFQARYYRPHD
jgi:hypothetical protein